LWSVIQFQKDDTCETPNVTVYVSWLDPIVVYK